MPPSPLLPAATLLLIDKICDDFERAWQACC
jgi:hypothetical protein